VLEEPKKNTNHNPPPRRTTSDDGMGSQEPWKRSGAKEHKRKANNIKKHQKSKEIKSTQDSTFRDRIFLAHKTSSSVTSKASVTTPKKGKITATSRIALTISCENNADKIRSAPTSPQHRLGRKAIPAPSRCTA